MDLDLCILRMHPTYFTFIHMRKLVLNYVSSLATYASHKMLPHCTKYLFT